MFLRRALPPLRELTGSLQVELALAAWDWRELAVHAAGVFISELEGGVGVWCMCWRRKIRCE